MNLAGYQDEATILHRLTPNIPITTNFHGLIKSLDYASWSPHLDLISWDSYPAYGEYPSRRAFRFDVMRGLKGGRSWLLMEQTPGQVEWRPQNPMKRPQELRLQSYQALAHGADGVVFFQWRLSCEGAEMFHSAVVGHAGHGDTRIFREVTERQGRAIERYVEAGGRFVTTYFSGVIDEDGRAWLGGYPGPLRRTLGLWIEEVDPYTPEMANTIVGGDAVELPFHRARCSQWAEVVRLEGASPIATFEQDYYAGFPAITQHQLGEGRAYYIATQLDDDRLGDFLGYLAKEAGIGSPLSAVPGIEVTVRQDEQHTPTSTYLFILNHLAVSAQVALPTPMKDIITNECWESQIELPPGEVAILVPDCSE